MGNFLALYLGMINDKQTGEQIMIKSKRDWKMSVRTVGKALDLVRDELQLIWTDPNQTTLCDNLLKAERSLERTLADIGITNYKRAAFKGSKGGI